jgi:hypothetical protein
LRNSRAMKKWPPFHIFDGSKYSIFLKCFWGNTSKSLISDSSRSTKMYFFCNYSLYHGCVFMISDISVISTDLKSSHNKAHSVDVDLVIKSGKGTTIKNNSSYNSTFCLSEIKESRRENASL